MNEYLKDDQEDYVIKPSKDKKKKDSVKKQSSFANLEENEVEVSA